MSTLLRDTISQVTRLFDADHAERLLAYPGTLWRKVEEEAKAELHELAEEVADWSAPAASDDTPATPPAADDTEKEAPAAAEDASPVVAADALPDVDATGHPDAI